MDRGKEFIESLRNVMDILHRGIGDFIQTIEPLIPLQDIVEICRNSLTFLESMNGWYSISPDYAQTTLFTLIHTLDDNLIKAVRSGKLSPSLIGVNEIQPHAPFIMDALLWLDPQILVSPNRMNVRIYVPKQFRPLWTVERIRAALQRQGIIFGIVDQEIARLLAEAETVPVKVAFGKEPIPGVDAVLEDCLEFKTTAGKPTISEDQRADLKELNLIRKVSKGQIIMKKIPAGSGVSGVDVYGEPVKAPKGQDTAFPSIRNTIISNDGLSLISAIDGCAYWKKGQWIVVPALKIAGNVDYSTGHIKATVTVIVLGNVLSGFRVESMGDVMVMGIVEGSRISAKGDVYLQGGIQGKEEAVIRAGGDIEAKFINEAQLHAGGTIRSHGAVTHSRLRAKRVLVQGKEAEVIGGKIEAGDEVYADKFGSQMGVKTLIRLGCDQEDLREEIQKIEADIAMIQGRIQRYAEAIQVLLNLQDEQENLPPEKIPIYEKLQASKTKAEEKQAMKKAGLEKVQTELDHTRQIVRRVRARKNIMPGVEITLLDQIKTFIQPTGPAIVVLTGDTIQILPYGEKMMNE